VKFFFDHDVPDDLSYLLRQLGHEVLLLRQVMLRTSSDLEVLQYAFENQAVLLTCNRDDFLALAATRPHHGIVVVVRRRTRIAERSALLRLIDRAGESGLVGNINFA